MRGQRSVEMQHGFPVAKVCAEICSLSVLGWLQWWKYHQLLQHPGLQNPRHS